MHERWQRLKGWINSHKALAAFLAIGLVLGAFLLYRKLKGGSASSFALPGSPPPAGPGGGGSGDAGAGSITPDLSPITDALQQDALSNQQAAAQQQSTLSSWLSSLKDLLSQQQQTLAARTLDPTGLDANGNPTGTTFVKTLNESFAKAQGGNPNPGRAPATFSNPAPGGSWGGQSGSQIQADFIAQAGGDVAKAASNWTAQHNAEVAQNGF